jgi:hypothetical protein
MAGSGGPVGGGPVGGGPVGGGPDRYEVTRLLDELSADDRKRVLSSAIDGLDPRDQDQVVPNSARTRSGMERTQSILSILVVGGFVVTLLFVITLIAINASGVAGTDLLQTIASIYSGLTGAVVGYFFGKGTDGGSSNDRA